MFLQSFITENALWKSLYVVSTEELHQLVQV